MAIPSEPTPLMARIERLKRENEELRGRVAELTEIVTSPEKTPP